MKKKIIFLGLTLLTLLFSVGTVLSTSKSLDSNFHSASADEIAEGYTWMTDFGNNHLGNSVWEKNYVSGYSDSPSIANNQMSFSTNHPGYWLSGSAYESKVQFDFHFKATGVGTSATNDNYNGGLIINLFCTNGGYVNSDSQLKAGPYIQLWDSRIRDTETLRNNNCPGWLFVNRDGAANTGVVLNVNSSGTILDEWNPYCNLNSWYHVRFSITYTGFDLYLSKGDVNQHPTFESDSEMTRITNWKPWSTPYDANTRFTLGLGSTNGAWVGYAIKNFSVLNCDGDFKTPLSSISSSLTPCFGPNSSDNYKAKYTGSNIEPKSVLKYNGIEMPEKWFTKSFTNNKELGIATATFNAINSTFYGNFTGSKTGQFEIVDGAMPPYYYFYNSQNWSNVYCYPYGEEVLGKWPGQAMTKQSDSPYFRINLSNTGASRVIFNNNSGSQTADLYTSPNQNFFHPDDGWIQGVLAGDFNSWSKDADIMSPSPTNTLQFSYTIKLRKDEQFKPVYLTFKDDAKTQKSEKWCQYSDAQELGAILSNQIVCGDDDGGCKLKVALSGEYTIYFKPKDGTDGGKSKIYIGDIASHTVTFDLKGHGSLDENTETVGEGGYVTRPADPSEQYYEFGGWYTDEQFEQKPFDFDNDTIGSNLTLYAKWTKKTTQVTMTFDTHGGNEISPISGTCGDPYTKPADPTKANNTFQGWDPSLPNLLPEESTTYNATWKVNNGTYLAGTFISDQWSREGGAIMSLTDKDYEFVLSNVTVPSDNAEMKVYFASNGYLTWEGEQSKEYGNPSVTWSSPLYQGTILSGRNCQIKKAGTYNIYFNTKTGAYHLNAVGYPENGRGFTINKLHGDKPTASEVKVATEWAGWTGTEYKASFSVQKDQYIQAYFQDATKADVYICRLNESTVQGWTYDADRGLKCPENGVYSFYLISKDGGATYEWISIYKEGEADAVNFAKNFNTCISGECSDAGGHTANLATVWASMVGKSKVEGKLCWGDLSNEAKAYFAQGAVSISTDVDACIVKYDHIFTKYYGSEVPSEILSDFMGRFTDSNGVVTVPSNRMHSYSLSESEDQTVLIVVIAASATLLATSSILLLLLKKKKKAK